MQKVKYHKTDLQFDESVAKAVERGLSEAHKTLPSWLLYDTTGDKIFQEIMRLPEYYPTRCEQQILHRYKEDFAHYFIGKENEFKLIELGPGDGSKTEILLKYLSEHHIPFQYYPVDISSNVLDEVTSRLNTRYPELQVVAIHSNYDEALPLVNGKDRKVILFMGANIGNFAEEEALRFLQQKAGDMSSQDIMMIGFDLKKDARIIERAYDDSKGVTREFNLNLLTRLNRELGANFDLEQFEHYPFYDPQTGTAKSFIMSLRSQSVYFEALGRSFFFQQWETINTEVSQKYDLIMIDQMISNAGLEICDIFFDEQHFFCDVLVSKKS